MSGFADDFDREYREGQEQARSGRSKQRSRDRQTGPNGARQSSATSSALRFKLTGFDQLKSSSTAEYLVKGLFPRKGLVIVWGPPKCGKSFWVFTVVMHIACGREDYRGHRVNKGEGVYLALEGQAGFPNRAQAFRQHFLQPGETVPAFRLCPATLDLIKDHKKLIADIQQQAANPAWVVIDTLNRSLVGSEGKDEDMAAYLRAADALQEAFNCLVIIIHHCGVDQTRPRGHTSQTGAADVQISVKKDAAGNVIATVEFAKDMAEGATFASRLEVVELGRDQDGDKITSCVIVPVDDAIAPEPAGRKTREPASCRTFRAAFTEALDSAGQPICVRAGAPTVRAVDVAKVKAEFDLRYATGETDTKKRADAQRKAFKRAMDKLSFEYATWVNGETEWIWATGKQT